jgi:hypothetical protein
LLGVSILSFLLLAFSGDDPAEIMARRMNINASDEMIKLTRAEMGLDKPLPVSVFQLGKGAILPETWEFQSIHRERFHRISRNFSYNVNIGWAFPSLDSFFHCPLLFFYAQDFDKHRGRPDYTCIKLYSEYVFPNVFGSVFCCFLLFAR